jgi:hypothetical protein
MKCAPQSAARGKGPLGGVPQVAVNSLLVLRFVLYKHFDFISILGGKSTPPSRLLPREHAPGVCQIYPVSFETR